MVGGFFGQLFSHVGYWLTHDWRGVTRFALGCEVVGLVFAGLMIFVMSVTNRRPNWATQLNHRTGVVEDGQGKRVRFWLLFGSAGPALLIVVGAVAGMVRAVAAHWWVVPVSVAAVALAIVVAVCVRWWWRTERQTSPASPAVLPASAPTPPVPYDQPYDRPYGQFSEDDQVVR